MVNRRWFGGVNINSLHVIVRDVKVSDKRINR